MSFCAVLAWVLLGFLLLLSFFGSAMDGNQGLINVRQMFYHEATLLAPFLQPYKYVFYVDLCSQ